jgi:hypothetical protein
MTSSSKLAPDDGNDEQHEDSDDGNGDDAVGGHAEKGGVSKRVKRASIWGAHPLINRQHRARGKTAQRTDGPCHAAS